ncbi:Transmembrane protein 8B [Armadillidium vulgare]|nr:Transmembrane protein 8B [Armadillidium vulgare]
MPRWYALQPKEIVNMCLKNFLRLDKFLFTKHTKTCRIFHFNIPIHTVNTVFNLTSNNTDGCSPRNITVYLQAESYPLVSPDGADFPKYSWISRQPVYQTTLLSDLTPAFLRVEAPQPGDWFMVAFIFDDSNRITQAGIFPSCYAWLQIDVSYHLQSELYVLETEKEPKNKFHYLSHRISEPTYYSFFVASDVWYGNIVIKNCKYTSNDTKEPEESESCPLSFIYRPLALPFYNAPNSVECNCSSEVLENCSLPFTPMPGDWHYVLISPSDGLVQFEIGIFLQGCKNKEDNYLKNISSIVFEEELLSSDFTNKLKSIISSSLNETNISDNYVNVTEEETSLDGIIQMDFISKNSVPETKDWIHPTFNNIEKRSINNYPSQKNETFDDIFLEYRDVDNVFSERTCGTSYFLSRKTFPGNFVYEFDFKPNANGSVPLMLNLSNQTPTTLSFEIQSIIDIGGTLAVDIALSPFTNTSVHNYTVHGCLSVRIRPSIEYVNGTVSCNRGKLMQVNSSDSSFYSNSLLIPYPEPGRWFYTLFPSCYLSNQSNLVPCSSTNVTTVIFSIASASCVMGKCGDYGACFQYISGGFIFSTCVCDVNRGYDCSDGSEAIPDWKLLLSTLLLCLSNLFFLPAIILALFRKFYAEAIIYAFTMFFSTFYHACDVDVYNFCLMRLSVLQFCDFYSAILAFWVTLIVMANLPQTIYSILHIAGAVLVALGVENDRTGLWVFAIPAISALAIMFLAWAIHTKKDNSCYPPRKYWLRSFLPGTLLAATGLICYAFLQTEDNYYLIHSIWHSVMALSILCLLPARRKENSAFGY